MSNSGPSSEIEPLDADPGPSTPASSRRLFYTRNTAEDFFRQFNEVLDRRDNALEASLRSHEASIRMLNETIVTLTAAVERLIATQRGTSPSGLSGSPPLGLHPP